MMKILESKRAFTLVEILIAISIFSVAIVISSTIFINIVQLEKQNSIQDVLYEDARIIFQQITNEMHNGTIDYEEYYNVNVIQAGEVDDNVYFGGYYGAYGSRFFDPGKSLYFPANDPKNPTNLGTECTFPADPDPFTDMTPPADCDITYAYSVDLNTGQNPFVYGGVTGDMANAFCDVNTIGCDVVADLGISDELFIIDASGTKKTIIAKKKTTADGDYGLGIVRLSGSDVDQNGFVDTFSCDDEFSCVDSAAIISAHIPHLDAVQDGDYSLPSRGDLNVAFLDDIGGSNFVPITPLRSSVKDIKFIINPLEDPYKAYSEADVLSQPSVTILLTLELSMQTAKDYPGDFEELTLQTTVSAGVIGAVESFPPTADLRWLSDDGVIVIPADAYTPTIN